MEAAPKKKKINSKSKGSGFENVVAKKFSAALSPLKFIRTQGSGARVGGKNFDTLGQMFGEEALKLFVGDVVPVNEKEAGIEFRFSVEAKFYKTPDSFPSLVSGTSNFFKWFEEAVTDAVKIDKAPCLIFKWNHTSIFVAIYEKDSKGRIPRFTINNGTYLLSVYDMAELLTDRDFWLK